MLYNNAYVSFQLINPQLRFIYLFRISPDLRPAIYCAAIANGGDAEWDFILQQYEVADVGLPSKYLPDVARISLVEALGCAKKTYRLAK